jgi:hypothetical protein
MSQTIPDIPISYAEWVDVNTLSGIPVGTATAIFNKGDSALYLYEGDVAPAVDSKDGVILSTLYNPFGVANVLPGSERIWARCAVIYKNTRLGIQIV